VQRSLAGGALLEEGLTGAPDRPRMMERILQSQKISTIELYYGLKVDTVEKLASRPSDRLHAGKNI
jgi:hypothetical protein